MIVIKFIYIVQLQLQTFETMNYEANKSIKFNLAFYSELLVLFKKHNVALI